jgi:tetratricopeptide (TPR) repeat protein
MRRVVAAFLAVSAMAAGADVNSDPFSAALREPWERIGTADFELYSNAGNAAAREALNQMERVRGFFLRASPLPLLDQFPTRIILFRTPEQFAAYTSSPGQRALFVNSAKRDDIVMAASPDEYGYAIHEYMHLIVRHSGLRLPLWLNEGWAEVYSTLRPMTGGVAVGDLLEHRMRTLQSGRWLDIDTLTTVDSQSPTYRGRGPTDMFYAESWALAHMLFLAPDYTQNFPKFLSALHRGNDFAESCRVAFGKTPPEVYGDLRAYFDRKKMYGKIFQAPLGKKGADTEVTKLEPFDARLALADLSAAVGRSAQARQEYAELSRAEPHRFEISESLGYLAMSEKDLAAARREFESAFEAGDPDPRMCAQLAQLELNDRQPPARIIAVLERALQSRPDFTDALLQLGLMRIAGHEWASGVATLVKVERIRPDQADAVYAALAYARFELGDLVRARKDAETARQYAKEPGGVKRLEAVIALIDARAKSPVPPQPGEKTERVEGELRAIDCSAGRSRLVLTIGNKVMRFDLDVKSVEFVQNGATALKLGCGQRPPVWVTVEYAAASVLDRSTDGVVRRVEF